MGTKTVKLTFYTDDLNQQAEIPEGERYQFLIRYPDGSTQEFDTSLAGYQALGVHGAGILRKKRGPRKRSPEAAPAVPDLPAGELFTIKIAYYAYTTAKLAEIEAFKPYFKEVRVERGGGRNAYYHAPAAVAEAIATHIGREAQRMVEAAPAGDRTAKQKGHDLRRHGRRIRDQLTTT